MSLIWSDGLAAEQLPAPLLRQRAEAEARGKNAGLDALTRITAQDAARALDDALAATTTAANDVAAQAAAAGAPRTHALVIGVGRYDDAEIPALSTSIHGAEGFAEWLLAEFDYPRRPLGSVDLLLSPDAASGDWKPPDAAAARLGIAPGTSVPVETATFGNIRDAFARWLGRAGAHHENAAFLYFSGHGLWKKTPYLLPEDAGLASETAPFRNLIDIRQTLVNLFNAEPGVQCFFVDACQEFTNALQVNLDAAPGVPLGGSRNAELVKRDSWLFLGSEEGAYAYGPPNGPPFFTQELLACLKRRGAASNPVGSRWRVTTTSLATALGAAGKMRAERENQTIGFTSRCENHAFEGELYRFTGPPEVFVQVSCDPSATTGKAQLFVQTGGAPTRRAALLPGEWITTVPQGAFQAGALFDAPAGFVSAPVDLLAQPTLMPVELSVEESAGGGAG